MYTTIKIIHSASILLSFVGFFIRGILMIKESNILQAKFVKIAPHVVDTVLLVSAIMLVILSAQYPITHNWLTIKVVGLFLYIGLGLWAFRLGKTKQQKVIAWVSALIVFVLIIITAVTKPF